jgi:hypothetical protein
LLAGCGPSVHLSVQHEFPSLNPDCCPWLIEVKDPPPAGALVVASVGYGESGFSGHCSYPENRERLRVDACRLGADAVKIEAENLPDFISSCYRVRATFYRLGAGHDSEPEKTTVAEDTRGKCPTVLDRRFRETPP